MDASPRGGAAVTGSSFDGRRFHNPGESALRTFRDFLRWQVRANRRPWPRTVPLTRSPSLPDEVAPGTVVATFVNHATFLLQTGRLHVLTDPIWSDRASPLQWAGPRRVHPPGVPFAELPRIDVVLVSHNHYDHMDLGTLRRLHAAHRPRFVTTRGNRAWFEARGLTPVVELDWWESLDLGHAVVTLAPAQHFSARGIFDRNRTLWGSFVLEWDAPLVYFAADSGYWRHFAEVRQRFGPVDLALLPIGAYEPRWFMRPAHMNPDDAGRAHRDLDAALSLGMHFGTFRLTDEAWDDPPRALAAALAAQGIDPARFRAPQPGETFVVDGRSRARRTQET